MADWGDYARFAASLFAILTPFSAAPVFVHLTSGQSAAERERTARVATLTVAGVLFVSAIGGDLVLRVLGASVPSFRVGGGIVLFLMALAMLSAQVSTVQQTPDEAAAAESRETVGAVPLGVPLLAGPGAISSVIIEGQRAPDFGHTAGIIACIAAVSAAIYVTLRLAPEIGRRLGTIGVNVVNRLFGLVLAAIAVELIVGGLKQLFPTLA